MSAGGLVRITRLGDAAFGEIPFFGVLLPIFLAVAATTSGNFQTAHRRRVLLDIVLTFS
jgi:hypothetical protein